MTSDKKTLCKLGEIEDNFSKKNWVFATNSIVLILILLQPYDVGIRESEFVAKAKFRYITI